MSDGGWRHRDRRSRLDALVESVAERCREQPHLDDFLLWNAGTLEYWLHILISSIGNEQGWAARTEIPYITTCPSPTAKSNEKWADGAVVWPDGLAALIEVKTVPMRAALGATIEQVPRDLAALLAADWEATRLRPRVNDHYTDPLWWRERDRIDQPWGLQLTLVHGKRQPMKDTSPVVRGGINKGLTALKNMYGPTNPPWLRQLQACFEMPLQAIPIDTANAAGVLLAWADPIAPSF